MVSCRLNETEADVVLYIYTVLLFYYSFLSIVCTKQNRSIEFKVPFQQISTNGTKIETEE